MHLIRWRWAVSWHHSHIYRLGTEESMRLLQVALLLCPLLVCAFVHPSPLSQRSALAQLPSPLQLFAARTAKGCIAACANGNCNAMKSLTCMYCVCVCVVVTTAAAAAAGAKKKSAPKPKAKPAPAAATTTKKKATKAKPGSAASATAAKGKTAAVSVKTAASKAKPVAKEATKAKAGAASKRYTWMGL